MFPATWIEEAAERIRPYIRQTPLAYDPENKLYFKWENHQVTGSFKLRGAFNKVLQLQPWEREGGLVAASAGNHGQGVAMAGGQVGAKVIVFASEHAVPAKVEAMRKMGADVRLVPGGYGEAEQAGIEYAQTSGATWISPYNDGQIIAGQGTLALEACQQTPSIEQAIWVVPVGGGGLISGVGAWLKRDTISHASRLIGVQSEASAFFHTIFHQGTQEGVVELDSLADGLAGPVEDRSKTIPMVSHYVDDLILVSEQEIAQAITFAWRRYQEKIEGSAATALAAVISGKIQARPAVIVITGGNIQPEVHQRIIAGK